MTVFHPKEPRQAHGDLERVFDEEVGLLAEPAGRQEVHSTLSSGIRHPYRDSAGYALTLLDTGEVGRAAAVLRAVLAGQDTDEDSATYGIWPYFLEEPLAQMSPPDWNWADFLGTTLALVLIRHPGVLPAGLEGQVRAALEHAARSIVRRDVDMGYTNIAAKGTFVTLAAGQLLGDQGLTEYGVERIGRLRAEVLSAGSFAEYNSPTYWAVAAGSVAHILEHVADPRVAEPARWVWDRLWEHFARHWHSPTGQLSGPMSRCYRDDFAETGEGVVAMVARAVDYTGPFEAEALRRAGLLAEKDTSTAVKAPRHVVEQLAASPTGTARERFSLVPLTGREPHPVTGTTWRGERATLGSVNTSVFWGQRRPLQGYWRQEGDQPWQRARWARLRVLREEHDFCSAVFSSVQSGAQVLWAAGFVSPGGDDHIVFRHVPAGQALPTSSLRLVCELAGTAGAVVAVAGTPVTGVSEFAPGEAVTVAAGPVHLRLGIDHVVFGDHRPRLSVAVDRDGVRVVCELLPDGGEHPLVLADLEQAHIVGTFGMSETGPPAVESGPAAVEVEGPAVRCGWTTPEGSRLRLRAPARVTTLEGHLALYDADEDLENGQCCSSPHFVEA